MTKKSNMSTGAVGDDLVPQAPLAKPWWTSKTLWVNGLLAGGAIVAEVLALLQGGSLNGAGFAIGGLSIVNIVLRVITKTAISN